MASNMIGNLAVNLTMETAAFQRGATIAEKRAQAMQTRMQGIGNSIKGIGAGLVAGFAAAGAGALVSNAFQIASSMQEAADATGVTIEQLQRLRVAATQNGASADQMDASLTKLSAKLGELQQGSKQAVDAFAAIGLSVEQLKGKNPAEAFALIVEKISAIKDPTLQAAAAKDILGKSYGQLLPLIKAGTAALDEATAASIKNGEISTQDAKKLDELADGWENLKTRVGVGIANIIASLANGAQAFDNFFAPINKFARDFDAAFVRMASNAVASVQKLVSGVKTWLVDKLSSLLNTVTKKITAVGQSFFQLYDDVVGHSYVPDMARGVIDWFQKMESGMIASTDSATGKVSQKMEEMQNTVQGLMRELFPEAAAAAGIEKKIEQWRDAFKAGLIPDNKTYLAGLTVLENEFVIAKQAANEFAKSISQPIDMSNLELTADHIPRVSDAIIDLQDKSRKTFLSVVSDFENISGAIGYAANAIGNSIRNVGQAFKGGGFFDKIGAIADLISVGAGAFGSIKQSIDGARANGGPVGRGKTYLVGERGPELYTASRSGYITSNKNMNSSGGSMRVEIVDTTGLFETRVTQTASNVTQSGIGALESRRNFSTRRSIG